MTLFRVLGQNAFTITVHILSGIQLVFKHRVEWEGEYLIQWIDQDGTVTDFMSDPIGRT